MIYFTLNISFKLPKCFPRLHFLKSRVLSASLISFPGILIGPCLNLGSPLDLDAFSLTRARHSAHMVQYTSRTSILSLPCRHLVQAVRQSTNGDSCGRKTSTTKTGSRRTRCMACLKNGVTVFTRGVL